MTPPRALARLTSSCARPRSRLAARPRRGGGKVPITRSADPALPQGRDLAERRAARKRAPLRKASPPTGFALAGSARKRRGAPGSFFRAARQGRALEARVRRATPDIARRRAARANTATQSELRGLVQKYPRRAALLLPGQRALRRPALRGASPFTERGRRSTVLQSTPDGYSYRFLGE